MANKQKTPVAGPAGMGSKFHLVLSGHLLCDVLRTFLRSWSRGRNAREEAGGGQKLGQPVT